MATKRESEVPITKDTQYIRGIDNTGKSIRILKSDLAEVITNVMRVVTTDKNGLFSSSFFNQIKNHATKVSNGNGSNVNQCNGRPCLVVAYDNTYFERYVIYVYWSNPQRTSHRIVPLAQYGGMSVKVSNSLGTVVIDGAPIEDIEQYSLYF